jgi:hypothetical protein
MSEWLKIMLEEIARKRADAELALEEERRRAPLDATERRKIPDRRKPQSDSQND